jgi:hypothetical protein
MQKLPHLLDSDIMHNFPPEHNTDTEHWFNWFGQLPKGIDKLTTTFLKDILQIQKETEIPELTLLISQLNVNRGGLGLFNASLRAVPDFVLNMMISLR